ncbi:NAD(P)H-hydrate dehydratase [Polynucleobacter necessarius]|uniref:NAD(P)H-hydrate dehydratase n=1 Tax=Polynucleobacter necessarius TaxID=576610 RepID=UPI000E098CEC|nr:NAD(P)H-hydrate dehydratase [Polynucleobacter necessarius]
MTSVPAKLNTIDLLHRLKRAPAEHKGNAGKALLIGGAPGMAGALLLAGKACLHLGAGWTILEMFDPASARAQDAQPELMIRLASDQAHTILAQTQPDVIAIGPGLGNSPLAIEWLKACLTYPHIPLILDADALNLIADSDKLLNTLRERNAQFPNKSVCTPHPGEAAKLLKISAEKIQGDRLHALQQLITLTQSIGILKGQNTVIASPNHSAVQCEAGNPGMGTGGMGDVLTGTITAIAAQGVRHQLPLWDASSIAVELHATAADSLVSKGVGPIGLTPSETIMEMRGILNKLL